MCQGHRRYRIYMLRYYLFLNQVGCIGLRRSSHDNVSAMPVYVEFNVDHGNQLCDVTWDRYTLFRLRRLNNPCPQLLFDRSIAGKKCYGVGLETFAPLDNFNTLADIVYRFNVYTK